MKKTHICLLLPLCFGCACATTSQLSMDIAEQGKLSRAFKNQPRFLRISFFVTPFFDDETHQLLSPVNPAWLEPSPSGEIEALLPAATPVRILKVEFPTALALRKRSPHGPRTRTWVYVVTQHSLRPLILVLRDTFKNADDFETELDRFLTPMNPSSQMAEFSAEEHAAIRSKEAILGISAQALEMALGYPESKIIAFEGAQKIETWHWGKGEGGEGQEAWKKTVNLRRGRVVLLWQPPSPPPPTP